MELVDYVTNTPQNTNRTILKQLVNSEKNKAVYESVEELKRDGGVGYTERKKIVLTFDGSTEGKPSFMECYQISDEVIDINTIISLIANDRESGETVDIFEKMSDMGVDLTVQENGDSAILKFEVNSSATFLLIVIFADTDFYDTLLPKGTYVLSNDSMYISHVEAETKTIHTINPKYLPEGLGGAQPVVLEVPQTAWDALLAGNNIPVDSAMAEQIEKAYSDGVPLYMKCINDMDTVTMIQQIKFECVIYNYFKGAETLGLVFVGIFGSINGGSSSVCVTYYRDPSEARISAKVSESTE